MSIQTERDLGLGMDIAVEFKNERTDATWLRDDIEYIKKRINTARSVNSHNLDAYSGRYYESAKTLTDLMEIVVRALPTYRPKYFRTMVDVGKISSVTSNGHYDMSDGTQMEMIIELSYTGNYKVVEETDLILVQYSYPLGYYKLTISVKHGDQTKSATVGKTPITQIVSNHEGNEFDVWAANPNGILSYPDNFPIPSILADHIIKAAELVLQPPESC